VTFIANHAEHEVIFIDGSLLTQLWPVVDSTPSVRYVVVMNDGGDYLLPDDRRVAAYEELLAAATPVEFENVDEDRAASICYTSGTTGAPRATYTRTGRSFCTLWAS
jgi:fatty-acyl-CoA synthase